MMGSPGDARRQVRVQATPPQRSWGEQIPPSQAATLPDGFVSGKAPAPSIRTDIVDIRSQGLDQGRYLKALGDCSTTAAVLKEFSEEALVETIAGPPWMGPSMRVRMVYDAISHCQDIYGQMAVYLRLNGVVPLASRRRV